MYDHRRYQAIIGASEAAAGQVALRLRDGRKVPAQGADEALDRIAGLVGAHSTELW